MSEALTYDHRPLDQEAYRERVQELGTISMHGNIERPQLSWVEFHALDRISSGISYIDVAALRWVSPDTVRVNLSSAGKKLGAINTPNAVSIAIESLVLPISIGHKLAHDFNEQEAKVLELLASGYVNSQICFKLELPIGIVRNHISSMHYKLGSRNRPHAVRRGYEVGVLYPDIGFSG
jgi:DNA-binding CsgD family transcriptional regulator